MNPEQWRQVDRIFNEALDRAPGERMRFVEEACAGDVALRKEVETLIIAQVQAGSFMETPSVRIEAGTRFGPYEVRSPIGAGGMGEVYCAHDTKLKRDVALKVLPELFASDVDRLARFKREAQMLASLNHPNIGAIYGLEEAGGRMALVLELVEGPTLAERIAQGPISIDQALPIARQIAEALEAAHERGIIHRDLKPANIKITADGKVKVLDFGLARMRNAADWNTDPANSPTAMTETIPGMIIGTAAYMSPEQAKGTDADRTSDVWAFGCVLYEMLTGRRAFEGETMTDILGSVLKVDPDWSVLPKITPTGIRRLLGRCLQKDRKHRLHDIIDVRILIEDAGAEPEHAGPNAAPPAPRRREFLKWLVAGGAVVAAGDVLERLYFRNPPVGPLETRLDILTPTTVDPISFALSPDGHQIVYVASGDGASQLWVRSLASATAQPLAGSEGASFPFWSPDSKSVGFFADGTLKRIDIAGGALRTLATAAVRGGTWNADGVILFAPTTSSALFRLTASGAQGAVTKLDRQMGHKFPFFLPDGRQFLYFAQGSAETGGIYLGSLESGKTKRLTPADTRGVYLPWPLEKIGGWLVWVRAGTLVAQRLDLDEKALTGDQVTLADPVAFDTNFNMGAVSVSATGLVAYRTGAGNPRQLTWFDRAGKPLGPLGGPDKNDLRTPSISSDGRVAVSRTVQGNTDIWLLDGTHMNPFTFDAAQDRSPIWSPDGRQIVFDSERRGQLHRDLYRSSGVGAEELLLDSPQRLVPTDWSANDHVLYFSRDPQTEVDLWVLPLTGDRTGTPWMFLKSNSNFAERAARFSPPDGHWVAYQSNESGRFEIYIRPFIAPAASGARGNAAAANMQLPVSTEGGIHPVWRHDGTELYYVGPNGEMMAARITTTGTTLQRGTPEKLFPTRIFGGGVDIGQGRQYDVDKNNRFLINTVLDEGSAPITLIQNWKPPAK